MMWNDMVGRHLGQYTILEEIGRGGSSRVYRAADAAASRTVALKVIPNDAEDRVGFVRRFEREVRVVAQLSHPNIVSVYDRGETDDLVYLVMECVLGGTLKQRLGRPLPISEATTVIAQMARALHHAHQRGIVHRDVKPSNMLVDAADTRHLLLTDFGIAKLQGTRGLTKSGTTIGTPEYMAPEQAEGKEIDQRADVYALGCVLYEALSGRPPFVGSTPVSVLYQQVHSRPAYIRGFNPDVPRELARVVEQALAKRPDERFGTAEMLAEALLPYMDGLTAPTSLPADAPQPPRQPRTPSIPALDSRAPGPAAPRVPPDSGNLWILEQARRPPATPPPLARPATGGLGQEGLDALFPHDADETSQHGDMLPPAMHELASGSPPPSAATGPTARTRPPSGSPSSPIPLPNFRLPSKPTRPLNMPLTSDGRLDLDWLLQQEAEATRQNTAGTADPSGSARAQAGGQIRSGDVGSYVPGGRRPGVEREPLTEESAEQVTSLRRALLASGQPPRPPKPVWRPDPAETVDNAPRRPRQPAGRQRQRPLWVGGAVAAVLMLFIVAWVAVSASGLSLARRARSVPTPTSTVAPTPIPTSTPQPEPSATPTTNPQQSLNREAAASFSGVTLATFIDKSCNGANSTSHFAAGAAIYVNLCASSQLASTSMTVVIRQHGTVLYTMVSGQFVSPGASYWYARFGLPSGTYDVLVTMPINGGTGVARDLTFTVG